MCHSTWLNQQKNSFSFNLVAGHKLERKWQSLLLHWHCAHNLNVTLARTIIVGKVDFSLTMLMMSMMIWMMMMMMIWMMMMMMMIVGVREFGSIIA